ncbi:putative Gamma-tubulin complex component 3 [Paratrimastix pyriformis]|uniref:Gamma-tubulin complex component 3 n=1 Tax=Paratrimastix pyriformis TaxID=342808 RepID=A0ABQ8U6Q9_9EUKA|nr:putative Gamma-tubulin complex component 3 [Paratrimastix pyriformis]
MFAMLRRWVFEGELDDAQGEFFVAQNPAVPCSDPAMWRSKYSLRPEMLPPFISPALAEQILLIGKSINFMRHCCQDTTWVDTSRQIAALVGGIVLSAPIITTPDCFACLPQPLPPRFHEHHSRLSCYEFTFTGMANLATVIGPIGQAFNKRLLALMLQKFALMHHCRGLKNYLLLAQGDFVQCLMDKISTELSKPASSLYRHNLLGLLEGAIRESNARYEEGDIANRLDVRIPEPKKGDKGWNVFSLTYHITMPIATMLTPEAMRSYQEVFAFLWLVKRVEHGLSGHGPCLTVRQANITVTTVTTATTAMPPHPFIASPHTYAHAQCSSMSPNSVTRQARRDLGAIPGLRTALHKAAVLRQRFHFFVSNTQYYIMFEATLPLLRVQHPVLHHVRLIACSRSLCADMSRYVSICVCVAQAALHFPVSNTQYYIMFEVLEWAWSELLEKARQADSLDAIMKAHTAYLDFIVEKVLMRPSDARRKVAPASAQAALSKDADTIRLGAIHRQVQTILETVLKFSAEVVAIEADAQTRLKELRRHEQQRVEAEKAGKWAIDDDRVDFEATGETASLMATREGQIDREFAPERLQKLEMAEAQYKQLFEELQQNIRELVRKGPHLRDLIPTFLVELCGGI